MEQPQGQFETKTLNVSLGAVNLLVATHVHTYTEGQTPASHLILFPRRVVL